jgi:hypothetical protein
MANRFFGLTEREKKEQEQIKLKALVDCEAERIKLIRCFRKSWLGWCAEEHRLFWSCFSTVCPPCINPRNIKSVTLSALYLFPE